MRPAVFKLEQAFERYEHVPGMYVLGSSDARTRTVKDLLSLAETPPDLDAIPLSYPPVPGDEALRAAIASTYRAVAPEQVLVTVGATEAIFLALHTLLGSGDTAGVPRPAFQALSEMVLSAGGLIEPYDYREAQGFQPDLTRLRELLGGQPPPKIIVLNNPHNPTGQMLDAEDLRSVLAAAEAAGTTAVVDEVFHGIWLGTTAPTPSAADLSPRAVVINSLSKAYGLSGLRIGWLVGPADFIAACKQWRHYTTNCAPAVVQQLALVAIQHRTKILAENEHLARTNHAEVRRWLAAHRDHFDWVEPQAGLVMLLRLKHPVDTEWFAADLADASRVYLVPCPPTFGMPTGYLRLGLGTDPGRFTEGLRRVSEYLGSARWRNIGAGG